MCFNAFRRLPRSSFVVRSSLLAAIGLLATTSLVAQEVGDRIVLVERAAHIPAHPAPGDGAVPFRFTSGSVAGVLRIDAATGWLEVAGEQLGGSAGVGWITSRYVARTVDDGADPDVLSSSLGWCPAKGSPDAHPSGRLRIATWNLGNLHAQDGGSTFTGGNPSVKRFPVDYERIKCYVRMFDPDVLAVQEVDGEEALSRVVDLDVYDAHVSSRPKPGSMGGRQNTGFAYKKGLDVVERSDEESLDVSDGGLRFGSRIDLTVNGQTFQMMSVHLKSGCFENGMSVVACNQLLDQLPALEAWIDAAAAGPNPFVVLGDFNRRLNQPGDVVWTEIDDGDPANADLLAVTDQMPLSCRNNQFTEFIDHIVVDLRAAAWVDRSSFRHVEYRQADRDDWDLISDHCPVVVEMWIGG